jgi:hypothetical protein
LVNSGDSHIEVVQELKTPFQGIIPVTTRLTVDTTGATFETPDIQEDSIPLSFDIQKANASVELAFDISTAQQPNGEQVVAYQVAQLIKDNAIDYLAIDLRPHSASWSDAPLGLEQWLNACPYYKLVYSEGDIRIYQVDLLALP